MSELFLQKKELIFQVYDKARKTTTETSFSGILKNLEYVLLDDFNVPLSYRTFETYYKNLVEGNRDYKIKTATLNDLSRYLGYSDFKEFCEENPIRYQATNVKVIIDGAETSKETRSFSDIIINITNSPVFTIPEFISKHSNSFGLIGILLVVGFLFKQNESYFEFNKKEEAKRINNFVSMEKNQETTRPVPISDIPENAVNKSIQIRKRECMYWHEDHYEEAYCDEAAEGKEIVALNNEKKMLRKITMPDTLTVENAIGKVWYDKSNNKVEFFTHHGIHPENGKTLKHVTPYIIRKYAKK